MLASLAPPSHFDVVLPRRALLARPSMSTNRPRRAWRVHETPAKHALVSPRKPQARNEHSPADDGEGSHAQHVWDGSTADVDWNPTLAPKQPSPSSRWRAPSSLHPSGAFVPIGTVAQTFAALHKAHAETRAAPIDLALRTVQSAVMTTLDVAEARVLVPGAPIDPESLTHVVLRLGLLDRATSGGSLVRAPPFGPPGLHGVPGLELVHRVLCVPALGPVLEPGSAESGKPSVCALIVAINPRQGRGFSTADEEIARLFAALVADACAAHVRALNDLPGGAEYQRAWAPPGPRPYLSVEDAREALERAKRGWQREEGGRIPRSRQYSAALKSTAA